MSRPREATSVASSTERDFDLNLLRAPRRLFWAEDEDPDSESVFTHTPSHSVQAFTQFLILKTKNGFWIEHQEDKQLMLLIKIFGWRTRDIWWCFKTVFKK